MELTVNPPLTESEMDSDDDDDDDDNDKLKMLNFKYLIGGKILFAQ